MTDEQIRDEALTLLLAGHETTANALVVDVASPVAASRMPRRRLHEEVDGVLARTAAGRRRRPASRLHTGRAGRIDAPVSACLSSGPARARAAYRGAWDRLRAAPANGCVSQPVPAASGPAVLGRARAFRAGTLVRTDGGCTGRPPLRLLSVRRRSRVCIGEQFAWMEGILILATLSRRWQFRSVPGRPVEPQPIVTLRPKHGLRMQPIARRGADAGALM